MSDVYDFSDYRSYLLFRLKPRTGPVRGVLLALSKASGIHPSVLSQVLKRVRDLNPEQAVATAEFLGLSEVESKYFLLLVQLERAGTEGLRKLIRGDLERILMNARQVSQVMPASERLPEEQKAIFYSNWFYSAARVFSSMEKFHDPQVLRKKLGLEVDQFEQIISFLIKHSLLVSEMGRLSPGTPTTHLDGRSPLISRHHANWRMKAMQRHPSLDNLKELAYSAPVSLSLADVDKVRKLALDLIQASCKIIDPSFPEVAYCLNIDWFEI